MGIMKLQRRSHRSRSRTSLAAAYALILLAVGGGVALPPTAVAQPQSVSFELPHLQADPGQTVSASVLVTDWLGLTGLSVIKFCVQYAPNLLATPIVTLGSAYEAVVPPGAFSVNLDEPGLACITINSAEPVPLSANALVNLEFVVHPLAHDGEVTALVMVGSDGGEVVLLENPNDPPPGVKPQVSEGSVTVVSGPSCVQGDASVDGVVNSADAIIILRIDTALIPDPSEEQLCGADANLDRVVNVADAIWVLRETVGLPHKLLAPGGSPRARWVQAGGGAQLRIEGATGLHGLALDLVYDPATTRLEAMAAPAVGLRVQGEAAPGERRVRWASGTSLAGPAGDLELDVPTTARGEGATVAITSLQGYDALGRVVAIELEGEAVVHLGGSRDLLPSPALALVSYPNPFNPATTLRFDLPRAGRVRVDVYDATGKHVARLLDETRPAGPAEVRWDGTDRSGRRVSSGVYLARLSALHLTASQRLVLLK